MPAITNYSNCDNNKMVYEVRRSVSETKPSLNPQNVTYLIEMFDI